MLYMINEYVAEFPKRIILPVKKFEDAQKYLHEMEISEVNEYVATWTPLGAKTITDHRNSIKLYLNWLAEQGCKINFNIADVEFPEKKAEFKIYSNADIHNMWKEVFASCDRQATRSGDNFSRVPFLIEYAAGILSFYGMTFEEIMELDLSDVQPTGVVGRDLPLTKEDIDILLEYKGITQLENRKYLTSAKYLRCAGDVTPKNVHNALTRCNLEEDKMWMRKVLACGNLYKMGVFDRMYKEEKSSRRILAENARIFPDWFIKGKIEAIGTKASSSTESAFKRDYLAYKKERDKVEVKRVVVQSQENDVVKMLDGVIAELDRMKSVVQSIKEKLNEKNK